MSAIDAHLFDIKKKLDQLLELEIEKLKSMKIIEAYIISDKPLFNHKPVKKDKNAPIIYALGKSLDNSQVVLQPLGQVEGDGPPLVKQDKEPEPYFVAEKASVPTEQIGEK